jgi:predicted acyltransferase (DUF342 family)
MTSARAKTPLALPANDKISCRLIVVSSDTTEGQEKQRRHEGNAADHRVHVSLEQDVQSARRRGKCVAARTVHLRWNVQQRSLRAQP